MSGDGHIRIRPARNHVVVRKIDADLRDEKSGMFLPKDFQNHVMRCVVTDVGDGNHDCTMEIEEGDIVLLPKHGSMKVESDGGEYHLCNVMDIIGVE